MKGVGRDDAIEVRLSTSGPWVRATYVEPYPKIGRSYHRVKLAVPKRIDSMTGDLCDASNPRGHLTTNDFIPAQRIRTARIKIKVARFRLDVTRSFVQGAPQREEYFDDGYFERKCREYAEEWRLTYDCAGCDEVECPQCGAEGSP